MNAPISLSGAPISEHRSQTWVFRVASAPEVGGGHMRRCLALAQAMAPNARIVFVLDREGADVWTPTAADSDLACTVAGCEPNGPWDGCVIDGYQFGPQDFAQWRGRAGHLVLIDDLGLAAPEADLIVRPGRSDMTAGRPGATVLAGPQYAMLDGAFTQPPCAAARDRVEEIFVSFGLRDSANATGLALEALELLAGEGFQPRITVALGSRVPALKRVEAQIKEFGERARLLVDASNVRALLDAADLAVGAGGVGLYERLAAGVPTTTINIADNQRSGAQQAADAGATLFLGNAGAITPAGLAPTIRELAFDRAWRQRLSENGRTLVDGRGAERVARKILELVSTK